MPVGQNRAQQIINVFKYTEGIAVDEKHRHSSILASALDLSELRYSCNGYGLDRVTGMNSRVPV